MATAFGRHVVVTFDDVNDAEEFAAAVSVEGAVFFMGTDTHFRNIDVAATRVNGLFGKPNVFCECPYTEDMKFVRGQKYGLYVHDVCKKPVGGHSQTAPINLLNPKGVDVKKRPFPMGLMTKEGVTRWPEPKGKSDALPET